jgi:hypothetical protein
VSAIGCTEQYGDLERIECPVAWASRKRTTDRVELVAQPRDRPPVAVCDFSEERTDRLPQVRIIDQVVFGTSFVAPSYERQPFGLLGVQGSQALLDRHALYLRRRARDLFGRGDALQVFSQMGG